VVRPSSREAYLRELVAGGSAPPPRAAELARRFAYRLYFEQMLPVPAVREDPTGFHAAGTPAVAERGAALMARLRRLAATARRHAEGDTKPA
jgi:hypothetical protein